MTPHDKVLIKSLMTGIAPVIADHIKDALEPLTKRLEALEAKPTLRYCGVWSKDVGYGEGASVTHEGSLWIAKSVTQAGERPGDGPAFQLAVKRGRDGRDGGR